MSRSGRLVLTLNWVQGRLCFIFVIVTTLMSLITFFRPTPKKARKAEAPSGLVPSWTKFVNTPSKPTGARGKARGASESRSISTTQVVSTRRANIPSATVTSHNEPEPSVGTNGEDDPAFAFGGLPSDEEPVPEDSMKYPVCYHIDCHTTNVSNGHSQSQLLG